MIKIAGLDMSISSTGVIVETLDDDFNLVKVERFGFTHTAKWEQDGIVLCRNDAFNETYDRYMFNINHVLEWVKGCDYVAVEDYGFAAVGLVFDLAEFEGFIRLSMFNAGKKLRTYPPKSNKKFFSGSGSSDKLSMLQAFESYTELKPDISSLPEVKSGKGVSPTSDIIDAYALCEFLRKELRLKNGKEKIEDQQQHVAECFGVKKTRKGTQVEPNSLLNKPFIEKR